MDATAPDWNPEAYAAFADLRLRPALDLLASVPALPPGEVVDLGCGNGAALPALRRLGRRVVGVDASPAMLAEARGYDATVEADIARWQPETPPALIFSNAALHWLADHEALFPRLAAMLAPGGTLAVQMPRQFHAPSHALIRSVAAGLFPDRFSAAGYEAPVSAPETYWHRLSPLGMVRVWETEYLQELGASAVAHPVRRFTESTACRPVTAWLSDLETAAFLASYDAALRDPYPPQPDGRVLMPFRRLFVILTRS
jgi:trans-aconitate 2-methyltransferase